MAIFRSLKALISRTSNNSRSFHTCAATFPSPYAPLFYSNHRFSYPPHLTLLPLSKWIDFPIRNGPLFLSCPPWKLSQSATPLYMRGNAVVLRKVQELNHLIRIRGNSFPLKLGLASVSPETAPWDRPVVSEKPGDGLVESFVNWPNLISMSRLISGPFIGWMITNDMYFSACVALAISGATDWLDGYIARKMKINSVVGSYLDPLADKVLIGCVAFAMIQNDLLHPGLVGLIVTRDVLLVGGAVYKRATSVDWKSISWRDFFNLDGTHAEKVQPIFLSKVNTVFQLVLVAAALLQPEFGTEETQLYITYLSWLVASTTVVSTAAYGAQYIRRRSAITH